MSAGLGSGRNVEAAELNVSIPRGTLEITERSTASGTVCELREYPFGDDRYEVRAVADPDWRRVLAAWRDYAQRKGLAPAPSTELSELIGGGK